MNKHLYAGALALFISLGAVAQERAVPVKDFDVFVDPPTGFVFIKLPAGWKFVTRLDRLDLTQLPRNVHTALLVPEGDGQPGPAAPSGQGPSKALAQGNPP